MIFFLYSNAFYISLKDVLTIQNTWIINKNWYSIYNKTLKEPQVQQLTDTCTM